MTGEEVVGPAGPKLVRLLYFVGAGYICTAAINKWRDIQRKSFQLPEKPSNAFFMQAKTICPSDPHVYNKLGVVAHHMKEYKKAVRWFEKTLAHIPSSLSEMWEPTVVNLAHSLRKLKRYHEAITYYEKALALSTRSLSTYAGLAYTYICRIILLQQLPTITRFYG